MRVTFRADQVVVQEMDGVLVVGGSASERAGVGDLDCIVFQRMEGDEDGLHFEYRDQRHGGYGLVAACRLRRNRLEIDLSHSIDGLEGVDGFTVDLDIDDEAYHRFQDGLKRILDGTGPRLTVD